jgi:hypothetical protein
MVKVDVKTFGWGFQAEHQLPAPSMPVHIKNNAIISDTSILIENGVVTINKN